MVPLDQEVKDEKKSDIARAMSGPKLHAGLWPAILRAWPWTLKFARNFNFF